MAKSVEMENFLDEMAKALFGHSRDASIESGFCVYCGSEAKSFRNAISRREFSISGFCQECQDKTFGMD